MADKRNRLQKSGSLLGALIIESFSILAILGLYYIVQDERSQSESIDELVKPKTFFHESTSSIPKSILIGNSSVVEARSSRRIAPTPAAVLNQPTFRWREPTRFRR